MKSKKTLIAFASIALLATVGIATSYAAGNFTAGNKEEFKAQIEAHRQEMDQILTNKDFNAWQGQMMERATFLEEQAAKIRDNATRDNFDQMVQAYQLRQNGDYEAVREIMEQLHKESNFGSMMGGFGPGFGNAGRMHRLMGNAAAN
ncbi:MAG: hypothetical protein COU85_00155 [Candidatus Portnoybacteria bacterium CG10_big_fil_rev_8_21_14_0_10_44_7]|uniref:DUF2680 domain-containing protein n=1 Tax=Candidatus Portnoybacteria bacterium CG10_big_fil_rev_8_21_14_0_10_44_7 TaxID=1974816 RepID=A0A2M8KJK9_9BACT|nr:MAG: hypothetical protein COU85_00155 [Candidatus Portnoybacteria bacterium CG10_big_fil_rev_8_21_14_0_10_44_7]